MELLRRYSNREDLTKSIQNVLDRIAANDRTDEPGLYPAGADGEPAVSHGSALRRQQRRLTPEQIQQLVAEYEAGDDIKVLAARWGIHRNTVSRCLRRAGVELRRQGLSEQQLDDAVRRYEQGWSCVRLAERFGVDDGTVWLAFKRAGVQMRRPWERGGVTDASAGRRSID